MAKSVFLDYTKSGATLLQKEGIDALTRLEGDITC